MANLHQAGSQVHSQDFADPEVAVICCNKEVVFECEVCPWSSPPPWRAGRGFGFPEWPVGKIGVVRGQWNGDERVGPWSETFGPDREL